GENLTDHETRFSHGRTLYDSTLRVLAAFRGPGIGRGALWGGRVENIDVLPTVARVPSQPVEPEWEGRCLLDLYRARGDSSAAAPPSELAQTAGAASHAPVVAQLQRD